MNHPEVNPSDLAARMALRTSLRRLRADLKLSGQCVSRLAGFDDPGAVRAMERGTSWAVWRVQAWARGLGWVFRMRITGLEVPADDATAMVLKANIPFGGLDEDLLHLRVIAHDLIRTRKAVMSRSEMARRCGVTAGATDDWEARPEESLLLMYQRYTRALGGALELELQPAGVAVGS